MIPTNPIHALAGGEFLSIITFSILLGIFIINTGGQSAETLRRFFQAGFARAYCLFCIRTIGIFFSGWVVFFFEIPNPPFKPDHLGDQNVQGRPYRPPFLIRGCCH